MMQRELAELWAESKQLPTVSCPGKEQAQPQQQQAQHLSQLQDAAASRADATRKSNEKRKASSERSSSEVNKGSKLSGSLGGSHDSAAGLWSTQAVPKCDAGPAHSFRDDSDSSACIRWLPFKVRNS